MMVGRAILAGFLALLSAAAPAHADETVWLQISVAASDPAQAAEAAALREGRRLGPVVTGFADRAYPVPGFLAVPGSRLDRGLTIAPARGQSGGLVLRRAADGDFLLFDGEGVVLAVLPAVGEGAVVGVDLPMHLVRPILPSNPAGGVAEVARARGSGLARPLRIASAQGNLGTMMRSHQKGVEAQQAAPLGAPIFLYLPTGQLVPQAEPEAARSGRATAVNLGANLQARWHFASRPPGAVVRLDGVAEPVATDIGVRNLPAAVARTLVMRKEGYRDCRFADAFSDVIIRGGLEWNSVVCSMRRDTEDPKAGE